jgi:hypothetical protein
MILNARSKLESNAGGRGARAEELLVPVDRRSIGDSLEMCTEHMLEEHHDAITSRLENSFKEVEVHITLVSSSKQNHKQERSFPRGRDSSPDGYITVQHDYKLPVRHDFKLGARYECTAMCWGPFEATHLLLTNSKKTTNDKTLS